MVAVATTKNLPAASDKTYVSHPALTDLQTSVVPAGTPIPGDESISIKRSLVLEVEMTPDGYLARSGELDEEGYGTTREDAIIDFLSSLIDRLRSLEKRTSPLSDADQATLQHLRDLLS